MARQAPGKADDAARLASLRAQVDGVMRERVSPAMASAAETAQSAVRDAASTVRQQSERLSGGVRATPLLAIAIAACAGFLVARLLR